MAVWGGLPKRINVKWSRRERVMVARHEVPGKHDITTRPVGYGMIGDRRLDTFERTKRSEFATPGQLLTPYPPGRAHGFAFPGTSCLAAFTDHGAPNAHTPIRPHAHTPTRSQAGVSLVEMSIALVLFTTVAVFGLQTIMAGWILQNSAIMQSMTDARAGIETAYAQRWTFAAINSTDVEATPNPTKTTPYTLWPVYPASITSTVIIGTTPKGAVNAKVVRTCHQYTDPLTGAQSYMLESYVVYQDKLRQYCKLSKVYRSQ